VTDVTDILMLFIETATNGMESSSEKMPAPHGLDAGIDIS
jgi:hypothetical protein